MIYIRFNFKDDKVDRVEESLTERTKHAPCINNSWKHRQFCLFSFTILVIKKRVTSQVIIENG